MDRLLCLLPLLVLMMANMAKVSEGETLREQKQRLMLTRALMTLDPCQRGVWSCCQSEVDVAVLPVHCFEGHGCFGLHWEGVDACSMTSRNEVARRLKTAIERERNNEHWTQK